MVTQQQTIQSYIDREELALERSEYDRGRIIEMPPDTIDHGVICSNTLVELGNFLQTKNCSYLVLNGQVRIFIKSHDALVYPNVMVVPKKINISTRVPDSVTNPVLVVEVLSKSTERYDRGDKFQKYCSLPSFREYVLIDAKKPVVDVLYREGHASWKMVTTIGLDKSIYLHTLDATIAMTDLYKNTIELGPVSFKREA